MNISPLCRYLRLIRIIIILIFSSSMLSSFVQAQEDDPSILTLDKVLSSSFRAKSFDPVLWQKDGAGYFILEDSEADKGVKEVVRYDAETGNREVVVPSWRLVPPGESTPPRIESFSLSRGRSKLLLSINRKKNPPGRGDSEDIWILDLMGWNWHKLGGDAAPRSLSEARFSPDGRRVSYIRDNDIYVEDLRSFKIIRLTNDGADRLFNGRDKAGMDSHLNYGYRELILGRDGHAWSPDGKTISYVQTDFNEIPDFYMINNTETLYPRIIKFPYIKVGQKMPSYRLGVVPADGGETRWLNVPGDHSEDYLWQMEWRADSNNLVLQVLNRLQNTMKVMLVDVRSGEITTILVESDSAWVEPNYIHWLKGGEQFTWMSEQDGWMRVYLYSLSGRELRPLTPERADVIVIQGVDEKNGWLYYMASPDNPTQRYLYRVSLDGKRAAEKITPEDSPGTHRYYTSPDLRWAMHSFSTINIPPVYDLISLPEHASLKILEDNEELSENIAKIKKKPTEFFRVDIGDGIELDGYFIAPPDFDPQKKYPLLHYIYGEPAGQTVLDRWDGRRYLWHLMLAQQGYLVMSIDPRGTPAPKGRNWRKSVYLQLGTVAANDHAAATRKIIASRPYVDPDRIGIYGHSGGGQMSLNLIFRFPDLYHLAMPSSFVSHQRFYHPSYQERVMGFIEDNAAGYKNGSPITWAHQLKGKLLIIHGSGDSNVHYQSFEALVNELVIHKKQFSMMVYPNRNHGLKEGKNTQYHLLNLRTDFLLKNMPPGSAPALVIK